MTEENPVKEHPMTCGHMSTTETCPYECPDSKPSNPVVEEAVEDTEIEP